MKCPRCRSLVIRQYGEVVCFACGWDGPAPTGVVREMLAQEVIAANGKTRKRAPSFQGQPL